MPTKLPDWFVYNGSVSPVSDASRERWLRHAPPWRQSLVEQPIAVDEGFWAIDDGTELARRGQQYILEDVKTLTLINAGLLLRRPLLVVGEPGLGKSLLAWSLAYRLGLGRPLVWPVNSKSTLEDALYRYEAIAHLRASRRAPSLDPAREEAGDPAADDATLGEFVTLGPLGTAMLPWSRPRVLLVDEIDKASFDLPNDLLHVLEERRFVIPELLRVRTDKVDVVTWDSRQGQRVKVPIANGTVHAGHFPVVLFTSNGDREFPPAFLRRCVSIRLERLAPPALARIASAQLQRTVSEAEVDEALRAFGGHSEPATDQVLSALFLQTTHQVPAADSVRALVRSDRT